MIVLHSEFQFNLCKIFQYTYYNIYNQLIFAMQLQQIRKDPFILECCLPSKQQPFIGVDGCCNKNAVFCIQHNCHINSEGLMHQMMPLREFKRKIDSRKYEMQAKVGQLISTFSSFIDRLIQQIRQIKLRKCLQLSMLWLTDLSCSEDEYELMKRVYRMDFTNVTCQQIHSIYFKIIHNEQLYKKQIGQINCYKGISNVLSEIANNKKAIQMLADKITQIEGVLTNGEILKRVLPDRKIINQQLKQVMLQEISDNQNFNILYNKSNLIASSSKFKAFFSKYSIIPHITYHISIKTKYLSIMLGICSQKLKQAKDVQDLNYKQQSIVFNLANGNTYKQGMFVSGSNASIKNLTQLNIKLRLTDSEVFLMTNKSVLMRSSLDNLVGSLYLLFEARTEGDCFQVYCDNDISADNVKVLNLIQEQQQLKNRKQRKQNSYKQNNNQQQLCKETENLDQNQNQQLIYSISKQLNEKSKLLSSQAPASDFQNTFGAKSIKKKKKKIDSSQQFQLYQIKAPKTSQQLSKLRSSFQQLKRSIAKNDQFSNEQLDRQKKKNQWNQQKAKHLKQIRDKVNAFKYKSKPPTQPIVHKLQEIKQQFGKSNLYPKLDVQKFKSQSSLGSYPLKIQSEQNHQSKSSKVKINISDADEVSDLASVAKNSMVGGLRRGSDNFNFNFQDISSKVKELMSQSIQPKLSPNRQQKLKQIKTPPKIKINHKNNDINESFDI